MCGILGFSSTTVCFSHKKFQANLSLLDHRGPDHQDFWMDDAEKNFMGFTRLSIMDLTESGNQPMVSNCGKYRLIFNGEIYNQLLLKNQLVECNYKFNSRSDAEVLLNSYIEWGKDCFKKFEGMFACAIYDIDRMELVLARDISGQKPLYFYQKNETLAYASELKPLVESIDKAKKINLNALNHYLGNGYIPKKESIYVDFQKLRGGEYLIYNTKTGTHKIKNFWKLSNSIEKEKNTNRFSNKSQLRDKLENLLESSVQRQLVSDAPLGMMLSGGVDSSLMVALASRHINKLDTYTVVFPGNNNYNEQKFAKLISKKFKTNHHELNAELIEPELIEKLVYFYDEPMADSSMMPTYLLSKEMSKYCKVAIGGDGADELFGGYNHYGKLMDLYSFSKFLPAKLRKNLITYSLKLLPNDFRGKKTMELFGQDLVKMNYSSSLMFNIDERKILLKNNLDMVKNITFNSDLDFIPEADLIKRMTVNDFQNYMSEDILVKVDRASMANSLEVRSPFLDQKIIEFAFNDVPSSLKLEGSNKKILLKDLAKKILPVEFNLKRKQGFSIPINQLLIAGKWRDYFYSKISSFNGFEINKTYALEILANQKKGGHNGEKLFCLVQFICWYEHHIQSLDN